MFKYSRKSQNRAFVSLRIGIADQSWIFSQSEARTGCSENQKARHVYKSSSLVRISKQSSKQADITFHLSRHTPAR